MCSWPSENGEGARVEWRNGRTQRRININARSGGRRSRSREIPRQGGVPADVDENAVRTCAARRGDRGE